jgi:two-component system, chemotaxis family, CheB/CheR fusion protein
VTWPDDTDLRGYQLGAFDFLMKPIRPAVLRAKASVFIQLQESAIALQQKSEELRLEQQRAYELELQRASALQFETLANTLPLLAWYSNPDGTVRWFNARWYDYVGGTPGELESGNREGLLDPEQSARIRDKWSSALLSGEPWEDVFRIRRHDGERRWFLCRAVPLKDGQGRVIRWFGTNVDIDEQKSLEATAEAANRAKDEFLAMLGHELRNPLAPIQTALDLMEMQIPEVAQRERTIIDRQVKHLMRLVDDLLDVSRITQGKVELRRERLELSEVVARGVEMASPLLEKKSIRLAVDVAREGLSLRGDPIRLAQVIANVLNNAAKFSESGGVVTVRGELDEDTGALRVRIIDTGIGMSAEILPRVFDMFTQERQRAERAQGGLGLGLSIARSVVEMHSGTIRAYSGGLGRGSELVIELPAPKARGVSQSGERATAVSSSLQRLRVLIVDDNEDAAQMLAEVLARSGYDVRFAYDGPAALALVRGFSPDIAVLDLGLPVMDGYELLAQLRLTPGLEALRFIAVTGYGQAEDLLRTEEAGFSIHLVKPISLKQVRDAIEQVRARDLGAPPKC